MKTISKLIFIFSVILLSSCEKINTPTSFNKDALIGNWVKPVLIDTVWKYERANALNTDDYGFAFNADQSFIERKNSGWCGTPPISYANFNGSWSIQDSLLNITVDYWGGEAKYQWKIISFEGDKLSIYKIDEDYTLY